MGECANLQSVQACQGCNTLIFGLIAGLTLFLALKNMQGRAVVAVASAISVLVFGASFLFVELSEDVTKSTQFAWVNFLVSAWGFGFAVLQILELNSQLARFRTRSTTLTYPRQMRTSLPQFAPLASWKPSTESKITKVQIKGYIELVSDIHAATLEAFEVEDFMTNQRKNLRDAGIYLAAILVDLKKMYELKADPISVPEDFPGRCIEAASLLNSFIPSQS